MNDIQATIPTRELAGHPGLEEIFILLCSGWDPLRVSILVGRKYGLPARVEDIRRYKAAIPQACFLGVERLAQKFRNVEGPIVDVVGEMSDLLLLMRDRIAANQLIEDEGGRPKESIVSLVKVYFAMLEKYTNVLQEFGVVPDKPKAAPVQIGEPSEMTLKDIIDGRGAVSEVSADALHSAGTENTRLLRSTNK